MLYFQLFDTIAIRENISQPLTSDPIIKVILKPLLIQLHITYYPRDEMEYKKKNGEEKTKKRTNNEHKLPPEKWLPPVYTQKSDHIQIE